MQDTGYRFQVYRYRYRCKFRFKFRIMVIGYKSQAIDTGLGSGYRVQIIGDR